MDLCLIVTILQPQEPNPHLGTLNWGPGQVGGGVGHGRPCDFSPTPCQSRPPSFSQENSFLKFPKEEPRTPWKSYPLGCLCSLQPLGHHPDVQFEALPTGPGPRLVGEGTREAPHRVESGMAPSLLWPVK